MIPRATSCRCCSVQTLRVSNISEDTKEADLQELFEPFGSIYRIYLAKDKDPPHHSRGFAFVSYNRREDAELAMSRLQVSKKKWKKKNSSSTVRLDRSASFVV